jgi:hypothetical protein
VSAARKDRVVVRGEHAVRRAVGDETLGAKLTAHPRLIASQPHVGFILCSARYVVTGECTPTPLLVNSESTPSGKGRDGRELIDQGEDQ